MATKNFKFFMLWALGRPCTDYIPYLNKNRDDFNYRALARATQMENETGIRQNGECQDYLMTIKEGLIAMGEMVTSLESPNNAGGNMPISRKKGEMTNSERRDYERLKEEVIRLTEELRNARAVTKKFGKMQEYLMEFGVIPR